MELAIVIVVLIALMALTFWARTRQLRRASLEIIERLREHGALRKGEAKTLEEMGLRFKPKHRFGLRDNQVEPLSLFLRQGIICFSKTARG